MKLNAQQERVVREPVGNILVSAAAGSGKTSVMTERIASRVIAGDLDLERVLVMTFTKAAASNMRRKIEKKLTDYLGTEPDVAGRNRVSAQLSALSSAHISTIHSFCLDVITNFGYEAKTSDDSILVEPGFSVLDEARAKLLLSEAIDEVLAALYEEMYRIGNSGEQEDLPPVENRLNPDLSAPFVFDGSPYDRRQWFLDFERVISSYGGNRDDRKLRDMLVSFLSFLRSMPDYSGWIAGKLHALRQTAEDFDASSEAVALMKEFETALTLCRENLPIIEDLLQTTAFIKDKKKNQVYCDLFAAQVTFVSSLIKAKEEGHLTFSFCCEAAKQLPEGKLPRRSPDDGQKAVFFARYRAMEEVLFYFGVRKSKEIKDAFLTNACAVFERPVKMVTDDLRYMYPVISRLFETCLLIDARYSGKKREENAVDFSDYEHMALLILQKEDAKQYYSSKFDEIYIDEYQDNSSIQEAIVAAFQRENCFVVGDVKQSIYRFRHARPQIFLQRMEDYLRLETGTVRELNSNYRSVPGILRFTNDVFEQILSKASGEIDYDERQRLVPEIPESEEFSGESAVELLLLDLSVDAESGATDPDDMAASEEDEGSVPETAQNDSSIPDNSDSAEESEYEGNGAQDTDDPDGDETVDPDRVEKEAGLVIMKIREMQASHRVSWSDIAVLCRTNREATLYTDALNRAGIPAAGGPEDTYLSNRELLLLENLIRIIDNFRQEIPLAAVMRSFLPQAGFSDSELLTIRLAFCQKHPSESFFFDAVTDYRENGADGALQQKLQSFCDWIESLRSASMYLSVSELIEKIYHETDIREILLSRFDATYAASTLDVFREWACGFDTGRTTGLFRFVTYMGQLRSRKEDPEIFTESAAAKEAVRCSSIHKSKGLEYRVVFLVGMDRSFRGRSSDKSVMLSEMYGIAADYINPALGVRYKTLIKMAAQMEESNMHLAECMRVFYVALTRAAEKLYLVGSIKRNSDGGISGSDRICLAAECKETALPAYLVRRARSYLDFCLLALARNPAVDLASLLSDGAAPAERHARFLPERTKDIHLRIIPYSAVLSATQDTRFDRSGDIDEKDFRDGEIEPEEAELFRLQVNGKYPYENMTNRPSKVTVSEIKRRVMDAEEDSRPITEEADAASYRPITLTVRDPSEKAAEASALSAVERGTLLHSVFQYLDFESLAENPTIPNVTRALDALVKEKMLREDQLRHVIPYADAIRMFAASDICGRMVAAQKRPMSGPYREIPFSLAVPLKPGDMCLVQGMIDCWFIENNTAILIDYKTDNLRGDDQAKMASLNDRYATQLDYYARAITSASGLRVAQRLIWLIPDGISFSLEAPEKKMTE